MFQETPHAGQFSASECFVFVCFSQAGPSVIGRSHICSICQSEKEHHFAKGKPHLKKKKARRRRRRKMSQSESPRVIHCEVASGRRKK